MSDDAAELIALGRRTGKTDLAASEHRRQLRLQFPVGMSPNERRHYWEGYDAGHLAGSMSVEAKAERRAGARPLALWGEDNGPVLWWTFPVNEPPYLGTPLDEEWPGHHTHWTRLVVPPDPPLQPPKEGV